jgi:hypothetical protein
MVKNAFPLAVLISLALVACGDKPAPSKGDGPFWAGDAQGNGAPTALPEASWHPRLPGSVRFAVPAHLNADVVYHSKNGAARRKLVFELLEAGQAEAEAVVSEALTLDGYVAEAPKPGKDGWYSIRYRKSGAPNITATFYPKLPRKTAHPDAKSMVAFSWQTKAAPRKEQG